MSTRHLLDHDLSPNGHRLLMQRGDDVAIVDGAVTLTGGNFFRLTGTGPLLYITVTDWLEGSPVFLQSPAGNAISYAYGASPPSGAVSISSASAVTVQAGRVAQLSYDGEAWVIVGVVSSLSSELPLADGIADPGDVASGEGAAKRHVHPLVPADTHGGKLYTAYIADPLQMASVDAVFHEQGGCDPSVFGTAWTEIASGVWRRNVAGHLLGALTDDVSAWVGMRLFAWSGAIEQEHTGPYVLDDIGEDPITHAETYPQMHRAPDFVTTAQVLHGKNFAVLQGTAWGGYAFQLTNADPIGEIDVAGLDWEIVTLPTPAPTRELLTVAQLGLAAPDSVTAAAEVSASTGEQDLVTCTEHDAVLGGAVIPGDQPFRFHVRVWVVVDDPAATTTVRCYLRGTNGSFVLLATTQSLHNETAGDFVAVGTWGSDYPLAIGEKLEVVYRAVSDSTGSVRVNLTFNNAAHSTYIEVPMVIGYAGTTDHQQLNNRGTFLAPASSATYGHPMSYIEPGWLQTPTSQRAVVGGLLALASSSPPVTSNSVTVVGTGPLVGIETTGKNNGDELTLFFLSAMTVTNQGTTGDAAYAPIAFGTMGLGTPPQDLTMTQYSCLKIGLYDIWRPVSPWFICEAT